ncbi:MAG: response regulator transcription factor [Deltaproteobacteria bacterium]|nr:response regulator transcription factor [Deltaproteobacteria bacterium]
MTAPRVRVLLVEDHQVVREGLRALLREEPDLEVVGETGDGREALRLAREVRPDVVIMDLTLEGMSGVEAIQQLRRELPDLPVVVLSMHDDAATVDRALRAGARGYVLKGRGVASLCEALRAARRGEVYLSPDVSEFVLQGYLTGDRPAEDPLTDRERHILGLIAEGLTAREIAGRLGLKPKTVENHRAAIMDKLGIHTTAGLVRHAVRTGLVR